MARAACLPSAVVTSRLTRSSSAIPDGAPLDTTFISSAQLAATVPVSNVAQSGTATVSVSNPGVRPSSNVQFLTIRFPFTAVSFGHSVIGTGIVPKGLVAADFNRDGNLRQVY